MTDCQANHQTNFNFFQVKSLTSEFNGGDISSDSGLLMIKEFENKVCFIKKISKCIEDTRDQRYVQHSIEQMLNQRIYQIIAGYEDCNDADFLRKDSVIKMTADKLPEDPDLASQPTLSRLENIVTRHDVKRLMKQLVKNFIDSFDKKPTEIELDVDSTDDPTHGNQQMSLFHGYYNQFQYFPLIISSNKHVLGSFLRHGSAHNTKLFIPVMKIIIKMIREAFPDVKLIIRCDAGFSGRRIYDFLDSIENLVYYVGISGNAVLRKQTTNLEEKAKKEFEKTEIKQRLLTSFKYAAGSWNKKRKVIAKAEHNINGSNIRYIVTNDKTKTAEKAYDYYCIRGNSERWIEQLKNGFYIDRLSCHSFIANQFRLLIYSMAYEILIMFNEKILIDTDLFDKTIDTIRKTIIKIGGQIKETFRKVWIRLASGFPYQDLFQQIHQKILAFQ